MMPTLKNGQIILGVKIRNYKPGDIIVININGIDQIKRILWLEEGKVFLQGDNKPESTDSRHYGSVDEKNIKHKVITRF